MSMLRLPALSTRITCAGCLIVALQPPVISHAQAKIDRGAQARRDKIEIIMRIQDRRTPHDGKLISLLSDTDGAVRERAVLAFGSIQDTTVLGLLTQALADPSPAVQRAAAFSIGQTALMLSPRGAQQLEYDLVWNRLARTSAADALIEELGKFGTDEGLKDLMIRVGNVHPLQNTRGVTMCIARYAIRGIISDEAVRYLLQFIRPPESIPWEAMYALQRVGDHPAIRGELDHVVQLYKHRDPVVRMHLASLLGKLRDERTSLEPLEKLAEFDGDWRVRVNALRALGRFALAGRSQSLLMFKRAFFDANHYVSLAALSAFGDLSLSVRDTTEELREALHQVRYIAENRGNDFPWPLQAEAAAALARVTRVDALPSILPTSQPYPRLQARLLSAVASTGAMQARPVLEEHLRDDSPVVVCAALEGLLTLSQAHPSDSALVKAAYTSAVSALSSNAMSVIATAAAALSDSLLRSPEAVPALLQALSSLHIPGDVEAMQEILATLGKLKDSRALVPLLELLKEPHRALVSAAAAALRDITGVDYTSRVQLAPEPLLTDFDFDYLRALPSRVRLLLETIRGDIVLELSKDAAPFTVMNLLKLATQRGYFRGTTFHRVVPNFVIQGGDPTGDGWGGPGYTIRSEFSPTSFGTGVLGMASAGKDTEGSQFFITQSPQPHLDGRYTVFGRVISGMDVVNRIQLDDRVFDIKIVN